jgi:hypothetical protein
MYVYSGEPSRTAALPSHIARERAAGVLQLAATFGVRRDPPARRSSEWEAR